MAKMYRISKIFSEEDVEELMQGVSKSWFVGLGWKGHERRPSFNSVNVLSTLRYTAW